MCNSSKKIHLTVEQQAEISELSKQGYQFIKDSLIHRAIEKFETILALDPENCYALVGLGDAYRKERNPQSALEYYQRCLNYHPDNRYALFGLADCYKNLGYLNMAIDIWGKYLTYDSGNVIVLTRMADAYRKISDFPRSKELYLKALEIDKGHSYALIGLGHLNYDFKRYESALKYWSQLEEKMGNVVDIRMLTSIGNCYRKLKFFEDGIPYFKKALAMQDNNAYALFGMADCYRGLRQPKKALEYWERILSHDPTNKVILTRAGDAYKTQGEHETAISYYQKALKVGYDTYAVLGLALIKMSEGKYTEALERLTEIIEREPTNNRPYVEAAKCLEKLERTEEAIALLKDYLNLGIPNEQISEFIEVLRSS